MPGELRTVVVDGLSIETTTHGAQVIERLQRQLSDAATATDAARTDHQRVVDGLQGQLAALNTTHRQAIEARDGEIAGLRASHATELATRDGEIAALRVAASDAALDQRVAQRTALVAQVRRVLGDTFDPTGRTDADMRRAVVVHAMGDALTEAETRSDAFFAAAFEAVVATRAAAPTAPARDAALAADPLRVAVATGIVAADAANQQPSAWQRHVDRLSNAWKNPSKEAV